MCGVHLCQGVWVGGHTLSFHSSRGQGVVQSACRAPGPGRGEGHPLGRTEAPLPRAGGRDPLWAVVTSVTKPAPFSSKTSRLNGGETEACVKRSNEEEYIYKHVHCVPGTKEKEKARKQAVLPQPLTILLLKSSETLLVTF